MPLQIAPTPYRGDAYLFNGISSAGQNIGEGIEAMTKRLRQTKAMRTMAVDGMGMDPDKVDNMSPEQIQGIMQGIAVKNAQAEANARVMMEQAHANYFNRFNQKADAEDRFSQAVNDYMQPLVPDVGSPLQQPLSGDAIKDMMSGADPTGTMQALTQPRTLTPQVLMGLEAKSGTLNPEKALQYMKELGGGAGQIPTSFDEDPITGNRFARHNGTIMPSGVDPAKVAAGPATSADDNFYFDGKRWIANKGKSMTDTDRGRLQAARDKEIDELVKAKGMMSSYGEPNPEDLAQIQERIDHHKKAIEALSAQDSPAANQPTPSKSNFKKGDRVKQNGVTYEFDGANWAAVK